MRIKQWRGFTILIFMISGCVLSPKYHRPVKDIPESYINKDLPHHTAQSEGSTGESQTFLQDLPVERYWWKAFRSPEINRLVELGLKNNPSVQNAQASLRASLRQVTADKGTLLPGVTASFIPASYKTSEVLQSNLASNGYYYSLYTAQLGITFVPDLFGAIHSQVRVDEAMVQQKEFELAGTFLTLISNIVTRAITIASLEAHLKLQRKIIDNQTMVFNLLKEREALGETSLGTVAVYEAMLASSKADLPPIEKALAIEQHGMAALLGEYPDKHKDIHIDINELYLPPKLRLSVPSTLVQNRPDVRVVEAQLKAANAAIGIAKAHRFPLVQLTGTSIGGANTQLSQLLGSAHSFWGVAGLFAQPIFQGGTLYYAQKKAEEEYRAVAAQYRSTVIHAFQDVANALAQIEADARLLDAATKAQQAAERSVTIRKKQLTMGDINVLSLQYAQVQYMHTQRERIDAQTLRLTDVVALYQALGGGRWYPQTPAASNLPSVW